MVQAKFAQKHVAQATEDQVSLNRAIVPNLKMVHAQFGLVVRKARSMVHLIRKRLGQWTQGVFSAIYPAKAGTACGEINAVIYPF